MNANSSNNSQIDESKNISRIDTSQVGWTPWLLIACLTVAASSSFGFGYGIGAPNQFKQYIDRTVKNLVPPYGTSANDTVTGTDLADKFIDGIPQTLFTIANAVGAYTGAKWYSIDAFHSRRKLFYANHPFLFASVFLVLVSYYAKSYPVYLMSRIFHGYHGGMACAIIPPYINEVASMKVRGAAGTIPQLFITIGILASQVVGLPTVLGRINTWHWGFFVGSMTSFIAIFVNHWIPESPTECVVKFKDNEAGIKNLRKLRQTDGVNGEVNAIIDEASTRHSGGSKMSMIELLQSKRYRWPITVSMTLLGGQALSGINAVFYYSGDIFREAGISADKMPYAIVMTGLINVIATIVAVKLMELVGRRVLIIYPGMVMSVVCVILAVLIKTNSAVDAESTRHKVVSLVIVILILLYVVCFAVGMGPIPYLYSTEIFRHEAKDAALVMGLLLNYLFNTLLSLTFPALVKVLGGYVFLIFSIILAMKIVLFWFKMPETKNKSIDEIEAFWNIQPT